MHGLLHQGACPDKAELARRLAGEELCVHFAIHPTRAWDNVHRHCALVLPFRNEAGLTSKFWDLGEPGGRY